MSDTTSEITEPPPWPHPTNPTEARRAADDRIAFRIHIALNLWTATSEQRWYVIDTPDGQFTVTLLTDDDVADWTPVPLDAEPR